MSALITAILADLGPDDLAALAERLSPYLPATADSTPAEPWIGVKEAATHLSCPVSRIYSLVSARRIPHAKDGSRTLFKRSQLDEWVRDGGGTRP